MSSMVVRYFPSAAPASTATNVVIPVPSCHPRRPEGRRDSIVYQAPPLPLGTVPDPITPGHRIEVKGNGRTQETAYASGSSFPLSLGRCDVVRTREPRKPSRMHKEPPRSLLNSGDEGEGCSGSESGTASEDERSLGSDTASETGSSQGQRRY